MNNPRSYTLQGDTGEFILTGIDANLIVSPAVLTDAIEKSELSLPHQTILITIIAELTKQGVVLLKEVISEVHSTLIDNPELWRNFFKIVESITSCN